MTSSLLQTWVHGLSLDSCSPTATILSSWYLEELRRNYNVVLAISNDLNTAFSSVVLRPCVPVQTIALVACMSCFWVELVNTHLISFNWLHGTHGRQIGNFVSQTTSVLS